MNVLFNEFILVRKPLCALLARTSATSSPSSTDVPYVRIVRATEPGPVRHGFIPEEW